MKKFCKKCGQRLPEGFTNFVSKSKAREFEDGFYCETCAKIKVEEARR